MLDERALGQDQPGLVPRVAIAWALVSALLIAVNWTAIASQRFPDPDDIMRLAQVRDLIAGQSWFDLTQYRVDAASGGVPMHWSRLIDLPIVLLVLGLTPVLGATSAEYAALVIVPLLTLGVVMYLTARIAWRMLGKQEAIYASLILAISVPVIFQLGPMRIDHHGWQIACGLLALNGLLARSPRLGGALIGLSCAAWMLISIEGLPLSAALFGVLALRWIRNADERVWLVSAIQSLAVSSAALFVITGAIGDIALYCDAIGPAHLAMFAWGALALTALAQPKMLSSTWLLTGFAITGAGAVAMLLAVAPQCAGGGFATLDPLVAEHWHANVSEGMPIWQQTLSTALQYAVTPLIGLFAAIRLAQKSDGATQRFWTDYALVLGAAFLVSVLVARAGAIACVIAAPPVAWQVNRWLTAIRTMDRPAPRVASMLAVLCALLPTFPLIIFTSAMPAEAHKAAGTGAIGHLKVSDCRIEDATEILNALPVGEVYAPLDIAPSLILSSHHSVVATGHHRGNEAMRLVIATSLGSSMDAEVSLRQRDTSYLALCPNLVEPRNYARLAPDGFMADLLDGREPDWLAPIPVANGSTLRLWRIKPE